MSSRWKFAEDVTVADLEAHPVWEFVMQEDRVPDTAVRPVTRIPVKGLSCRLVGTRIRLHNGTVRWALLGNISLRNPRATLHFLCVTVEENGQWFDLAPYHDTDFERRGPSALAAFLHLTTQEVFPIEYDISAVARGLPSVVRGSIPETVAERLTRDELLELCLKG